MEILISVSGAKIDKAKAEEILKAFAKKIVVESDQAYTIIEADAKTFLHRKLLKSGWTLIPTNNSSKNVVHKDYPGLVLSVDHPNDIDEEEASEFNVDIDAALTMLLVTAK